MRLFTAFENKSSILFVELQFLFFYTSAGIVSLPEQETSKEWRLCFVHSHLESHWIFLRKPHVTILNQMFEQQKLPNLYQLQPHESASKRVIVLP